MNFRDFILISEMTKLRALEILGLPFGSDSDLIRKTHRRLAMKFHPDRPGNDEAKFKEIQTAFDVLNGTTPADPEHCFEAFGKNKNEHTYSLLGYSPDQLGNCFFNHPNWDKVKDQDWSIDHIFPINAFVQHGLFDIKTINALDNLRPILSSENSSKKDKYNPVEFQKWLATKGISITI